MTKIKDILLILDKIAPFKTAMDFDNCGLLVGSGEKTVTKALLALDITSKVVSEAAQNGAQLIISHHPVIFNPLSKIEENTPPYLLCKYGIGAICAHTNLDMAENGVNFCLCEKIGLSSVCGMDTDEATGAPTWFSGELPEALSSDEFAALVKQKLSSKMVKYTRGSRKIKKVAVVSGSGGDMVFKAVSAHMDALLTAEIKHHEFIFASENDFTAVDAGHFETENITMPVLAKKLSEAFPEVSFMCAESGGNPAYII